MDILLDIVFAYRMCYLTFKLTRFGVVNPFSVVESKFFCSVGLIIVITPKSLKLLDLLYFFPKL